MAEPKNPSDNTEHAPAGSPNGEADALQDVVNQRLEELGYLDYGRDI